ncbi:MAG: hypothetical protein ACUVTO_07955 [Candidatus Caldatribacteriaceae bacterium]
MKRKFWFVFLLVVAGMVSLFLASGCFDAQAPSTGQAMKDGQAGTTLTAEKTATGFWEIRYDWTLEKSVTLNEDKSITYTLTATRTKFRRPSV